MTLLGWFVGLPVFRRLVGGDGNEAHTAGRRDALFVELASFRSLRSLYASRACRRVAFGAGHHEGSVASIFAPRNLPVWCELDNVDPVDGVELEVERLSIALHDGYCSIATVIAAVNWPG
jgi:hypothetical protein